MNVASLENCKKLYELSGWEIGRPHNSTHQYEEDKTGHVTAIPLYPLGYLLRKLPKFYEEGNTPFLLCIQPNPIYTDWSALYHHKSISPNHRKSESRFMTDGDTPEDAAALLAIKLFEQGILRKEG